MDNYETKPKKKRFVYVVILFLLILFVVFGFLIKSGKISFITGSKKDAETVGLKHIESVTVKSDGVYITDVSGVVDEVMPSIVAITSRTVINSGRFGPSFYGNDGKL